MVWVYDRTASLLVAMLMHPSLSASTLILQPPLTGATFLTWNLTLTAILWLVVAAVTPQPSRTSPYGCSPLDLSEIDIQLSAA